MLMSMAIVAFLLSGMIAVLGSDLSFNLEDDIKEQSLPLIANRIGLALYTADSMEEARIELDLNYRFDFYEEENNLIIGFRESAEEIETPIMNYNVDLSSDEVTTDHVCINVDGESPRISEGRC